MFCIKNCYLIFLVENSWMSTDTFCFVGLQQNRRDSLYDDIYANNELVSLLLKWCRVVCLFYGVKV